MDETKTKITIISNMCQSTKKNNQRKHLYHKYINGTTTIEAGLAFCLGAYHKEFSQGQDIIQNQV